DPHRFESGAFRRRSWYHYQELAGSKRLQRACSSSSVIFLFSPFDNVESLKGAQVLVIHVNQLRVSAAVSYEGEKLDYPLLGPYADPDAARQIHGFCQAAIFHHAGASQDTTTAFDHSKVFDYIYGTQSVHSHHVDPLLILAEASKELGMIFMTNGVVLWTPKSLNDCVLADLNVVALKPNVHRNVSAEGGMFLTVANAEKVISDAYKAGVRKEKLILEITPIAGTYDQVAEKEGRFTGYNKAITEFGASPLGDGTVFAPDGRLYYFFSKTRASCIVRVAKRHGLHGISLAGGYGDEQAFFPHGTCSLFSAIVGEIRSSIETR
ncbi:hypothetical protein FOZ62_031731, partial [Perkinsus olseni]